MRSTGHEFDTPAVEYQCRNIISKVIVPVQHCSVWLFENKGTGNMESCLMFVLSL
jgi:hypothetical protein